MVYDLVVTGGGPAGCAAALAGARMGANVLLLERGRYPRQKVCGEFVSSESVALLASLLLDEDRERLLMKAPRIGRARIFVDDSIVESPLSPPGISISRLDLDEALWRTCEANGVDARQQVAVEHVGRDDNRMFAVITSRGDFQGRTVVDASGRWSNLVSSRTNVSADVKKWLGLKAHFLEENSSDSVDVYFFEGGYCGVQPLGRGVVNACAMVRMGLETTLDKVLERNEALRARSRAWQQDAPAVTTFPLLFRKPTPETDGVLCAGDAAGFIDPFAGDGISLALASGTAATRALSGVWKDEYDVAHAAALYKEEYAERFMPALRNAALIRRLFGLPIPLRRIAGRIAKVPALSRQFIKLTRAA